MREAHLSSAGHETAWVKTLTRAEAEALYTVGGAGTEDDAGTEEDAARPLARSCLMPPPGLRLPDSPLSNLVHRLFTTDDWRIQLARFHARPYRLDDPEPEPSEARASQIPSSQSQSPSPRRPACASSEW